MSTRSLIGAVQEDGSVKFIYCHWDGYPEHNGKVLLSHYKSQEKVKSLLALGNLSFLAEKLGRRHSFDNAPDGVCTAYGRDRGEENTQAKCLPSSGEFLRKSMGTEYWYLFRNGKWYYSGLRKKYFRLLTRRRCKF